MASTLFLEKLQPAIRNGEKTYTYGCSFVTRNGNCVSERGISRFGPKRLNACRRHGRMYDEESTRLQERLEKDHANGLHGVGDARKPFAESHEDSSGFFTVRCYQCKADIEADELGVSADKLEAATVIKSYMERVQRSYDSAVKTFMEQVNAGNFIYAMDGSGPDLRRAAVEHEWCQNVLTAMKENNIDIVEAYNRVSDTAKHQLLMDNTDDDYDRTGTSKFIRRGSWTL